MSAPPRQTQTHASVVARVLAERAASPRRWAQRPRVVDLFSGAGGASWGATLAGCNVVACVNHWDVAIRSHAQAVPWAAHFCEDLERLSPMALPPHDVLWASPECTGHTKARGRERKHHDASRATAFCPVRVADLHRPAAVCIENVTELEAWPLLPGWLKLWECMGYREQRVRLVASDLGVPQERERVFFVFTLTSAPPVDLTLPAPVSPAPSTRSVIDLDTSLGRWSRWREEYVSASVARIEAALARQGGPCLVPYYGSESSHAGWSLDRPCGTLTRRDRFIVVVGDRARVLTLAEQRAIAGFPPDYPLAGSRADGVEQLGASVIPACAEFLLGRVLASVGQRRAGAQFSKARRQ